MSELTSSPPYLLGAALGGTTMSILSAAGTFVLEKTKPTPKSMMRDFILGAVLLLLIMQILPDSTGRLITWASTLIAIPAAAASASLPSITLPAVVTAASAAAPITSDEMEVKVGVPRF